MEFEFDPEKSRQNFEKHGIDFVNARRLWKDTKSKVILARSEDENRLMRIARLKGKCWSAVYTLREGRVRLISVRRSRKSEKDYYSSGTGPEV